MSTVNRIEININKVFSNLKCLSDIELYVMEEYLLESNKDFLSLTNLDKIDIDYDSFNFLDVEILDSVISEEECEVSSSYFDVGYGNYLPRFENNNNYDYIVDSLELLLNLEVLGVPVNIKCQIAFEESDENHFLSDSEAESYIEKFVDNFIEN